MARWAFVIQNDSYAPFLRRNTDGQKETTVTHKKRVRPPLFLFRVLWWSCQETNEQTNERKPPHEARLKRRKSGENVPNISIPRTGYKRAKTGGKQEGGTRNHSNGTATGKPHK